MSTLLLVQNLLTYFLTNTYLLAGHLLRVELSAGELALPLSAPGQVQHHQPEEQQVNHIFLEFSTQAQKKEAEQE